MFILCALSCILCSAVPVKAALVTTISDADVKSIFDNSPNSVKGTYIANDGTALPCRLYVPDDYDPTKSYPLVLFFHGADMRGTGNDSNTDSVGVTGNGGDTGCGGLSAVGVALFFILKKPRK